MDPRESRDNIESLAESLRKLEERISRLESYLGMQLAEAQLEPVPGKEEDEEELEFEVGQKWFAKAGIVVLAFGMAFVLTFPYQGLPPFLPSLFGVAVAAGMILLAHSWRASYILISQYLFGAGLALVYFSILRLFFFSDTPPLEPDSPAGILLLILVVAGILAVALRRDSIYLTGLGLLYGFGAALVLDHPFVVLAAITFLAVYIMLTRVQKGWNSILVLGTALAYFTHLLFSLGNPILGHEIQIISAPGIGIWFLLLYALLFAAATLRRPGPQTEGLGVVVASGLNVAGSYGIFLVLTLTSFQEAFVVSHLAVSVLFLTLAVLFWVEERSRFSTFIYSMFGYMALSVALLKAFTPPDVFVWLSLQSILVLSTAIWFRSRFIVVANFVIFLAIVIGYLVVSEGESGMSIGFGVVSLISARILNWQQDRLELKTEMMRNAYLTVAFCAFPYALVYLMPEGTASLSWVGVALFYYLMSALVKKHKYRWMGHLTLGLTVLYIMVIGIIQLEQTYRILSFLVLGCVLLVVSIFFTRLRARRRTEGGTDNPSET